MMLFVLGVTIYGYFSDPDFPVWALMIAAVPVTAVIDVKYGSSQVMQGAAEVIAYGTAVKIMKEEY